MVASTLNYTTKENIKMIGYTVSNIWIRGYRYEVGTIMHCTIAVYDKEVSSARVVDDYRATFNVSEPVSVRLMWK